MSEVNLMIHGRTYGVGCDEGQERRVRDLAAYIDQNVRQVAAAAGTSATEAHLLVLTALMMADELFDLQAQGTGMDQGLSQQLAQQTQENKILRNNIAVLQSQLNETQTLLSRARQEVEAAQNQAQQTQASATPADFSTEAEEEMSAAIQSLADRVASIAKRVQAA